MSRKRLAIAIVILLIAGVVAYVVARPPQATVKERIAAELSARGLPPESALCMATGLTERLSLTQLASLAKLLGGAGEAAVPLSLAEFAERVGRIDDPEVVSTAMTVASGCALRHGL